MKFLHTSDWHLGMTLRGGISYAHDQRFAIDSICHIAKEEKADGIIIAGDVFDKSIASQDAIRLYDEVMTRICAEMDIPVFIIAGNHDGAERISQCSDLLKSSGLYIAGSLREEAQVVSKGDTDIYLLPWISTDKVRSVFPEDSDRIESLEDAYRVVLDRYRRQLDKGRKNILVAHAFVRGAETSVSDRAAEIGGAAVVGSDVFDGFDYVALGHLHGPQKVTDSIYYSGSLMAYSFGREENQIKSVVMIDTDDMSKKVIPIPQLKKRKTIKGTFDEIMAANYDEETRSGYLRLEVTDSFIGIETIAAFRERYANLLEVTGKEYEKEDSRITMTVEELDEAASDPEEVFLRYYRDIIEDEPSGHIRELYSRAVENYVKEVEEA